eukprot:gene996-12224_t
MFTEVASHLLTASPPPSTSYPSTSGTHYLPIACKETP